MNRWKHWKFKNTSLLVLSLIALFFAADTEFAHDLIGHISELGYLGILLTGVFFVSTFTVAPASVVLFHLAQKFNPFEVALIAGFGGMVGDFLIFRFLRDKVFDELRPIFAKIGEGHLRHLFHTPYFAWLVPVVGAIIIASPFPDEVGIGLMGISKLKNWQFLPLTFFLNSLGILVIIILSKVFQ